MGTYIYTWAHTNVLGHKHAHMGTHTWTHTYTHTQTYNTHMDTDT